MKFTIEGVQQIKCRELGLDLKDMVILGYIKDFIGTGKMYCEIVNGETFYWVDYTSLIEELPILELNTVSIGRRFKKYVELGLCKKYVKKKGGTYTFISPDSKFKELFDYIPEEKQDVKKTPYNSKKPLSSKVQYNPQNQSKKSKFEGGFDVKPLSSKVQCNEKQCPEKYSTTVLKSTVPLSSKVQPNNPITNNPITNNPITKRENIYNINNTKDSLSKNTLSIVEAVVDYLNKKVGASYAGSNGRTKKDITRWINAGYGLDDFIKVIDKKTKEWLGVSHMEPQLTPWVLFGDKFERYLEQREVMHRKNNEYKNKLRFNNFTPREYDYDALERKLLGWDKDDE